MNPKRKICIITGSRAEYGLLYWLMKEIKDDHELQLQVIATGMHLSREFGLTYQNIEKDGFKIDAKVDMALSNDTPSGIVKSMGMGVIGFAEALSALQPDIIVVLGDRYEILAAAEAAMIMRIPIAHLGGGEATEGLIDEAIRHSLTKMSHFHFVCAEHYRRRVIQLGEHPSTVMNYGGTALDNIKRLSLLETQEFEKSIDFKLAKLNFLVTYHPVTLSHRSSSVAVEALLEALDKFSNAHVIMTKSNSDTDGRIINEMFAAYEQKNLGRVKLFASLGQIRYLSAIKNVDVVIGNSSSGIIEVPALKKPTVNIGSRQQGRLKATSIIDCEEDVSSIKNAIDKALSPKFHEIVSKTVSLYGDGNASKRIKETLKIAKLEGVLIKKFYEIPLKENQV